MNICTESLYLYPDDKVWDKRVVGQCFENINSCLLVGMRQEGVRNVAQNMFF